MAKDKMIYTVTAWRGPLSREWYMRVTDEGGNRLPSGRTKAQAFATTKRFVKACAEWRVRLVK